MLRELIAAIVVERACRLAELDRSRDAFTGDEFRWKTNNYDRTISAWDERLTGFEIVVASSNNGAVQNISLEIPGVKAIDHDEWFAQADYHRALATELLSRAGEGARSDTPAWGLIAGLLGRKLNRMKFVSTFWFGQNDTNPVVGLQDILKGHEKHPADWPVAVRRFRAVRDEVEALRKERTAVWASLAELARVKVRIEQDESNVRTARRRLDEAISDVARAAAVTARAAHEEKITLGARESHWRFRPSFLARAVGLGRSVRQWRARDRELATLMAEAGRRSQAARSSEADSKSVQRQATAVVQDTEARLDLLRSQFKVLDDEVTEARTRWGESVPGRDLPDIRRRELAGAWTDPQWNAARSRLFLAALQLHQDFLAAEPTRMRKNLHAATDVVAGIVGQDVPAEAVQAAWQSLFFVVPVLSTTFASFARVFSHLGRESLGWLFIDEAGQATPQAAVGAIWRSQRVVVVGDPMQLEPVVTLPFTAQQALRDHFGVAQWWLPSLSSAQRLADAANRYGTRLPTDNDSVWVGAPLRAHRRCLKPMFTISNSIAYDNLMVYGTADPIQALTAPESSWIDVPNAPSEGNWVPKEGEQANRILRGLVQRYGVEPGRIFILSPFRDGDIEIQKIISEEPRLRGGTVHKAQGKEADVVIFILGSNPNRPGTRKWASQRPNLVNVAVSRARQRLYVIGDFALWSEFPYFRELARNLPRKQ